MSLKKFEIAQMIAQWSKYAKLEDTFHREIWYSHQLRIAIYKNEHAAIRA